jgi:23S rRNA A1618 N6-methylase RlmF
MGVYTRKKQKRRDKFTRKQRGGNKSKKQRGGNKSKKLVFYTCFFGNTGSPADIVPELPSKNYDCYYFTNNIATSDKAKAVGWNVIFINKSIKGTNRDNAMDSKELKACPHHFEQLKGYTYSCYFDSKLRVKENDIKNMLNEIKGDVVMLVNRHPTAKGVREEFDLAMGQPRYSQNSDKYKKFMNSKFKSGLKEMVDVHYETSCIIRLSGDTANAIGDQWYKYIEETGAECQITFFFVQQEFKDNIRPLPVYYGRS